MVSTTLGLGFLIYPFQRFSKLFMTHLQAEFSKEADPKVKTLIGDQVSSISESIVRACR